MRKRIRGRRKGRIDTGRVGGESQGGREREREREREGGGKRERKKEWKTE